MYWWGGGNGGSKGPGQRSLGVKQILGEKEGLGGESPGEGGPGEGDVYNLGAPTEIRRAPWGKKATEGLDKKPKKWVGPPG